MGQPARGKEQSGRSHFLLKPPAPRTYFANLDVGAMAMVQLANLEAVYTKADTPVTLQKWLSETLELTRISDMVGYVEKEQYEREWRELVMGAFPIVAAQEAQEAEAASEGRLARPAQAAVAAFTDQQQRLLVSRMRTTYKVALGVEQAEEDDQKAAKQDAAQKAEDKLGGHAWMATGRIYEVRTKIPQQSCAIISG